MVYIELFCLHSVSLSCSVIGKNVKFKQIYIHLQSVYESLWM